MVKKNNEEVTGKVGSVTVSGFGDSRGVLYNFSGEIDSVTVNDDAYLLHAIGTITSATFNGGELENYGEIKKLDVHGGVLHSNNGDLGIVTVDGGELHNNGDKTWVSSVSVNGGSVFNENGNWGTVKLNSGYFEGYGSVDDLSVGANGIVSSLGGTIGKLAFEEGGRLLYDSSDYWWESDFWNGSTLFITEDADFSNATILFDFDDANANDALAFLANSSLFDFKQLFILGEDVNNQLLETILASNIFISQNGKVLDRYSFESLGDGVLALHDLSSTPKPATLLILGLGLAGLSIARRRKK